MPTTVTKDGRTLTWTGLNVCYCTRCEELFASPTAFDAHLKRPKGKQSGEGAARHDITGMPRNAKGHLVTKVWEPQAQKAFRKRAGNAT